MTDKEIGYEDLAWLWEEPLEDVVASLRAAAVGGGGEDGGGEATRPG